MRVDCQQCYRISMSTQITITLTDEAYQHAERFAKLANRDVASVLADTIQLSIPPVRDDALEIEALSNLSKDQILALTELQMEPEEDAVLSKLLDRQQAGLLTSQERLELQKLMQNYQEGILRKASALSEAVKRGLIDTLSS